MFFCFCPNTVLDYDRAAGVLSYGHITVKAPHPIRTAKLSTVELDQYFGRGLQGNLQCCMAFFIFLLLFYFFVTFYFLQSRTRNNGSSGFRAAAVLGVSGFRAAGVGRNTILMKQRREIK